MTMHYAQIDGFAQDYGNSSASVMSYLSLNIVISPQNCTCIKQFVWTHGMVKNKKKHPVVDLRGVGNGCL